MRESRCVDTCLCVPAWVSWSLCLSVHVDVSVSLRESVPSLADGKGSQTWGL